jgi:UDP-N-acetylglucosamine acyltransferase
VSQDIPPYTLAAGEHARLHGLNTTGLKRKEIAPATIQVLKKCYKIIFRSNLILKEAIQRVRQEVEQTPEVETLLNFLEQEANRGITR